jgi:hypothetical protein
VRNNSEHIQPVGGTNFSNASRSAKAILKMNIRFGLRRESKDVVEGTGSWDRVSGKVEITSISAEAAELRDELLAWIRQEFALQSERAGSRGFRSRLVGTPWWELRQI